MEYDVCDHTKKAISQSNDITTRMASDINHLERFTKVMSVFAVAMLVLLVYWFFEPDPLIIEDSGNNPDIYICSKGAFEFERFVSTDKELTVRIEPRLTDLTTGVVHVLTSKKYEGAPQSGNITYRHTIPSHFPMGVYKYEPYLVYSINPVKVISKKAPSQVVLFGCDLDKTVLSAATMIATDKSLPLTDRVFFINDILENWK